MGNRCIGISRGEKKREYIEKELNCEFINSDSPEQMGSHMCQLDLIVCTIAADFQIAHYLGLLKPRGTFCLVGVPPNEMHIHPVLFLMKGLKIAGSMVGGIKETQEMLDFCGKHGIESCIELIKPWEINRAWESLHQNENPKSRFVIDWEGEPVEGGDWETEKMENVDLPVTHPGAFIFGAPVDVSKCEPCKTK